MGEAMLLVAALKTSQIDGKVLQHERKSGNDFWKKDSEEEILIFPAFGFYWAHENKKKV